MRDSFDIDLEDPEAMGGNKPPAYDGHSYGNPNQAERDFRRDASPLPAPIPTKPSPLQRRSLEADTMFALEDERDSDDFGSMDGEEGKRLTGRRES